VHELLRIFAIAFGYPDGYDARRLADGPINKLLVDRDPCQGSPSPRSRRCRD
jgi:hypothetical protein